MEKCSKCNCEVNFFSPVHEIWKRTGLCGNCLLRTDPKDVQCKPLAADFKSEMLCPYCGVANEPDESDGLSDREECCYCGRSFSVERDYTVHYATEPLKEEPGPSGRRQMTLYAIVATVVHHTNDSHCVSVDRSIQIPTFYLDADVQGIIDEAHAETIAREIIIPVDLEYESVTVHITVKKVT